MKNLMKTLILALLLSACASKDLSKKANLVESTNPVKLDISAEVINEFSDEYNLLLQVNLRSTDGRWIRVDNVIVEPASIDDIPLNIIVGTDLITWAEAKKNELRMDQYNSMMTVLGVATLSGAALAVGTMTDNETLAAAGAVGYMGSMGYSTAKGMAEHRDLVQGVPLVPKSHLYSPFSVPSMSLVKRWILINAPSGRISKVLSLKIKTIEGDSLTYALKLKE